MTTIESLINFFLRNVFFAQNMQNTLFAFVKYDKFCKLALNSSSAKKCRQNRLLPPLIQKPVRKGPIIDWLVID